MLIRCDLCINLDDLESAFETPRRRNATAAVDPRGLHGHLVRDLLELEGTLLAERQPRAARAHPPPDAARFGTADVCEPSSMGSSSLMFAGTVDVTNSSNDSKPMVFNISSWSASDGPMWRRSKVSSLREFFVRLSLVRVFFVLSCSLSFGWS